jgi:hypothetical protein
MSKLIEAKKKKHDEVKHIHVQNAVPYSWNHSYQTQGEYGHTFRLDCPHRVAQRLITASSSFLVCEVLIGYGRSA